MKRLFWKEFREKRLWIPVLSLIAIFIVVRGSAFTFIGHDNAFSKWLFLFFITAFLFGAGAFKGEIGTGSIDFLFSRPVSWKKFLAMKVLADLFIILIAVTIAAITYRIIRPEQYAAFTTLAHLAVGIGNGMIWFSIAYTLGLACSVIIPGALGGVLVMFAIMIIGMVWATVCNRVNWIDMNAAGFAVLLAPAIAMLVIVRFGLTLPVRPRINRYALTLIAVMTVITVGFTILPSSVKEFWADNEPACWTFASPDGRYLIAQKDFVISSPLDSDSSYSRALTSTCFIRLSDGKKNIVLWPLGSRAFWINGNVAYDHNGNTLHIAVINKNGKITTQEVYMPDPKRPYPLWQSGKEVGYTDSTGKNHTIKVDD
jgi:ABC-type transport system involved in multi-copper enzyme maturation permease subunit